MKYFTELTRKLIAGLLEKDCEIANSYERVVFNSYLIYWKKVANPSEADLMAVRKFCEFCADSEIKVEALSREVRRLQKSRPELQDSNYEHRRHKTTKLVQQELGYKVSN